MTESGVQDRSVSSAVYRCVCGEAIQLAGEAKHCRACGRNYDASFLSLAGAETISVDSDLAPPRLLTDRESDPLLGERLGHFKILSRIGEGGMGSVYHALDESLQRHVALKVIHEPCDSRGDDLDRLFQEARAQARVNHPHVVHVYFVGKENQTPFLAMEMVAHGTLADRLEEGPLDFHALVRHATQITRALSCAAEYEIVHGDIKPSNVLVVDDHTVKLSDFGLARPLSGEVSAAKVSGTPDYMPPETTVSGTVDHRGDMYALGVTLFQLTFARLPYTIDEDAPLSQKLQLHRSAEVEFPERWPAELPEAWKEILGRLLEKDPRSRYRDFHELESDLQRVTPVNMTMANPLLRSLAWLIDVSLLMLGIVLIQVVATFGNLVIVRDVPVNESGIPELGLVGCLLQCVLAGAFLMGIALLQAQWGGTTGKRFLQILIVDQHGLKPRRRSLAARTAFQFSWPWLAAITAPLTFLGLPWLLNGLMAFVALVLIIELGWMSLRGGQSLHDSLFGTRVVLDTTSENGAAEGG